MTQNEIKAREESINELMSKGLIRNVKANGDIVYTEFFYKEMNRLMDAGKSSVEAYRELGFAPNLFGVNRAMQAGKNARYHVQYRFAPRNGTVPPNQVPGLASMTAEEQLNYFRSRVIYLEALVEEIKKKEVICGGKGLRIQLKFNPDKKLVMGMAESCMENFKRPEAPAEYGLDKPLRQSDILIIFNILERSWQSSRQRRQYQEEKLRKEAVEREMIELKIIEIIQRYQYIPGKRVILRELIGLYGITISLKRVKKIMDGMRLMTSIPNRNPYKFEDVHDHPQTAPGNLVNQDFFIAPRRVILTDITYLYYQKTSGSREVFYLCVFKDAFTSEILGHATSEHMDTGLIREAYEMMMNTHGEELREVQKKGQEVFVHSDQGSQFLSTTFQKLLSDDRFLQSCSRRGNSQDNAPCESFFQKLKYIIKDPLFLCISYEKCSEVVKGYIRNYNSKYIQTCLGGLSPADFYKYAVTGIYPFSEYFGVTPDITATEEIRRRQLQQRLKKQAEKALKERQNHKTEQELYGGSGGGVDPDAAEDPRKRVSKDIALLKRHLKWEQSIVNGCPQVMVYLNRHSQAAAQQVTFLNGVLREAQQAQEYMRYLPDADLEILSKPGSWKGVPWLAYAEKMREMFDYKPLHIFRNDLQKELRRVDLATISRNNRRWRNCPAGNEILAAVA